MHLDYGRAWTLFIPPVDTIMHYLKYRRLTGLATLCGRAMAGIVQSDFYLKQTDLVVPVPLFWWKQVRRGYNQAMLLAREVGANCGTVVADVLKRTRMTRTQTKLNEQQRRDNVFNAFVLKKNEVSGKKILIIDDVLTTGATIDECARVLKEAGAEKVYSLVAAITPW
jgi:ComF family protein